METLKRVQFDVRILVSVVREKIAPGAIQFYALRRRHGGLHRSRTHGISQRR